jgi:hypothetical protein
LAPAALSFERVDSHCGVVVGTPPCEPNPATLSDVALRLALPAGSDDHHVDPVVAVVVLSGR